MITIADIRDIGPCYNPSKYLKEDWNGSIQDILRMKNVPADDRLWVACNKQFISEDLLFKFSEQCCWEIVGFLPEDEQLKYCNILCIIRLARETSDDDLRYAARNAAGNAAGNVAWNVAWNAARNVARSAAWSAARNAARNVARSAAWGSAGGSAGSAKSNDFCFLLAGMIDDSRPNS